MTVDLCIITVYFHPVLSGGTERFRRYIPGLKARDVDVRVMTIAYQDSPQEEWVDGVHVRRFPIVSAKHKEPSAVLLKQSLQYFKETNSQPDVIHIISYGLQGAPHVWTARMRGISCVNAITMMPPDPSSLVHKVKLYVHQWIRYRPFNQIIASSQIVAQRIAQQGVGKKRIEIIPNGVDIKRFRPADSPEEKRALRATLGLKEDGLIIVFVGFHSYRKGVDLLLEAWAQIAADFANVALLLVGFEKSGPARANSFYSSTSSRELQEKIAAIAAPERVVSAGEVSNVEQYIRASDILILPSRREGMPNVVAEGMASGLPCMVTPFDGLPDEFGRPGEEYILTSFDPGKIAADLTQLLMYPNKRNAIGNSARSWVERHLDVENALDQYAGVYHRLAASGSRLIHR